MSRAASYAEVFAEWACALELDQVPESVQRKAKLHIVDAIGCAYAAQGSELPATIEQLCESSPEGSARPIGHTANMPADRAAIINGILIHALDFDDTHQQSYMHVTSPILSALLPLAQTHRIGGAKLLLAFIIGLEVSARLGIATGQRMHTKGFHPTSVFGTIGATVAVCKLLGETPTRTVSAIGIATSQASGLLAYLNDGADTKIIHPGWAAHSALWAQQLAESGLRGSTSAIEDPKGLYSTHVDSWDEPELSDLGVCWQTEQIAVKPYPVCHSAHGALGCFAELVAGSFDSAGVVSIDCQVPTEVVVNMVLEPQQHKRRPRSLYEARFSLPWLLGAYLKHGRLDLQVLADQNNLEDPEILRIAALVSYRLETFDEQHELGARVEVALANGEVRRLENLVPLGLPANQMSEHQITEKFLANLRFSKQQRGASELHELLMEIENADHTNLYL